MNRYLHFLCNVSYICLLVACIACGFDWECAHQKKHQLCRLGGQPWCLSLPAGGEGSGWAEEGEGGMVEGIPPIPNCIFIPLHFALLCRLSFFQRPLYN